MVFHYLKVLWQQGIIFGGRDNKDDKGSSIVDYLDSNWADNKGSRKSTSGFMFMLNRAQVS